MLTTKKKIIFIIFLFLILAAAFVIFKLTSKSTSSSASSSDSNSTTAPPNSNSTTAPPDSNSTTAPPDSNSTTPPPNPDSILSGMAGVYIPSWSYYRNGSGKFPNYENGVVSIPNLPAGLDFITYAFVLFDNKGNLTWGGIGTGGNVFNSDGTTINTSPSETIDFDTVKYIGSTSIKYKFISVGGYNFSQGPIYMWSIITQDPALVANLANQLVKMCKIYKLNGVDIDWELPQKPNELSDFMETAGPIFKTAGIILTLATDLNPNIIKTMYDFNSIDKYFSWYNLMSYDIHGNFPGTETFGANTDLSYIDQSIKQIISKGVSSSKLTFGLASYGRYTKLTNYKSNISALGQPCTLVDTEGTICLTETGSDKASYSGYTADCLSGPYTKTIGYLSYYEILDLLSSITPAPTPVYDSNTESTYVVLPKSDINTTINMAISYDTPANIIKKTQYASKNKLKGVFIWQLADDDFHNGFPITNTAITTIKNLTPPTISQTRTLYNIGLCGVPWKDTVFSLGKVNTCSTFGDPTTVGNGTLNCFGKKSCAATYNSACQIGSTTGNLLFQQTSTNNINDFLNTSCGSVVYQGAANADHFYEDYVKSGRILVCDCDGTQSALSLDCDGNSNMGQCLSAGFGKALPKNAMICTDSNISNCKLTCTARDIADPNPNGTATAYDSGGTAYKTYDIINGTTDDNICQGVAAFSEGAQTYCKDGQPSYKAGDVYVKSCGVLRLLNSKDCNHYCLP